MSSSADACPHCGDTSNKGWGLPKRLLVGAGVIWLIATMAADHRSPHPASPPATATTGPSEVELAAATRSRSARAAVAGIRTGLRDPDSLIIESLETSFDGKLVCVRYRARNGFGGFNREAVIFDGDVGTTASAKAWTTQCKALLDLTHLFN